MTKDLNVTIVPNDAKVTDSQRDRGLNVTLTSNEDKVTVRLSKQMAKVLQFMEGKGILRTSEIVRGVCGTLPYTKEDIQKIYNEYEDWTEHLWGVEQKTKNLKKRVSKSHKASITRTIRELEKAGLVEGIWNERPFFYGHKITQKGLELLKNRKLSVTLGQNFHKVTDT